MFSDIATIRDLNASFSPIWSPKSRYVFIRHALRFCAHVSDASPHYCLSSPQAYSVNTTLGDTFLDFVPYFKMYTSYVESSEHDRVKDLMAMLESKAPSSPFKAFASQHALARGAFLPALLITPVQRILGTGCS